MQVMTCHDWFDIDIEKVIMGGNRDVREIVLNNGDQAILLSKDDAVALAKDFGLIVYERNTNL